MYSYRAKGVPERDIHEALAQRVGAAISALKVRCALCMLSILRDSFHPFFFHYPNTTMQDELES